LLFRVGRNCSSWIAGHDDRLESARQTRYASAKRRDKNLRGDKT
jgi:hypothetical protein